MALDAIKTDLPLIEGRDASLFQEWGEVRAGGGDDSLINAAAGHHRPDTFLQWIVAAADRAASGLDRETFDARSQVRDEDPTTGRTHYTARQITLFEQVDCDGDERGDGGRECGGRRRAPDWSYRYPLDPLSPRSIFPVSAQACETNDRSVARAEYAKLWEDLRQALTRIPTSHRPNLPLWLDHFDALWLTFTHAVPAATAVGTIPDVSLYDHSRVVAALAAALWRYHRERDDDPDAVKADLAARRDWDEPRLLFIQGDLFGIQDFIFASGGEMTKRAAKLLRGRSFFVTLLAECAALRVLDALSLPPTSQIVNAAGKFQIIAPNTRDTIETLHALRKDLDGWFLRHTFGQSGIGIAWTEATCNDLQQGSREDSPYRRLLARLFDALDNAKRRRFDLCGERPAPPVFDDYLDRIGTHGLCGVDDRSPADGGVAEGDPEVRDGDRLSRLAQDQIRIGDLLAREARDRLLVTRQPLTGGNVDTLDIDVLGYRVGFTGDEDASGRFGHEARTGNLLRVWDLSLPQGNGTEALFHGYARRDVSAWIPRFDDMDLSDPSRYAGAATDESQAREPGRIKPFGELACEARARRGSGKEGPPGAEGWSGVPALMTLKGDVDNLGAIFQRGLLAPSLSRVAALSRQMNAFFAVHLPHLCRTEFPNTYTVFAGGDDFFLIGPWTDQMGLASRMRADFCRYVAGNSRIGFSVGLAMTRPGLPVRRLGAMAEEALEASKGHRIECLPPKNAVTCFGRTVGWKDLESLLDARERLAEQAERLKLSQGYVYGLLGLTDMFANLIEHPENALWRSRFHYRTWRALERVRNIDKRRKCLESLAAEIMEQGIERYGADYRIALFAHLYRNRT